MADISKYMHEHEQRQRAKEAAQKSKTAKPKKATAKRPASRGELIQLIQRAELASIRGGQDGQIWFNPKNGEIWLTHFVPADNYLPSAAAGKFLLLWETHAKKLEDVITLQGARDDDGQESEFYLRLLSDYVRGKHAYKFDPAAIADRLIEQKIKPALDGAPAPIKEEPAAADDGPAGGTGAPTGEQLLNVLAAFEAVVTKATEETANEARALIDALPDGEGWRNLSREDAIYMLNRLDGLVRELDGRGADSSDDAGA